MPDISTQEKIDYIYDYVKSQKKSQKINTIIKIVTWVIIIFGIFYTIKVAIPNMKEDIIDRITPDFLQN